MIISLALLLLAKQGIADTCLQDGRFTTDALGDAIGFRVTEHNSYIQKSGLMQRSHLHIGKMDEALKSIEWLYADLEKESQVTGEDIAEFRQAMINELTPLFAESAALDIEAQRIIKWIVKCSEEIDDLSEASDKQAAIAKLLAVTDLNNVPFHDRNLSWLMNVSFSVQTSLLLQNTEYSPTLEDMEYLLEQTSIDDFAKTMAEEEQQRLQTGATTPIPTYRLVGGLRKYSFLLSEYYFAIEQMAFNYYARVLRLKRDAQTTLPLLMGEIIPATDSLLSVQYILEAYAADEERARYTQLYKNILENVWDSIDKEEREYSREGYTEHSYLMKNDAAATEFRTLLDKYQTKLLRQTVYFNCDPQTNTFCYVNAEVLAELEKLHPETFREHSWLVFQATDAIAAPFTEQSKMVLSVNEYTHSLNELKKAIKNKVIAPYVSKLENIRNSFYAACFDPLVNIAHEHRIGDAVGFLFAGCKTSYTEMQETLDQVLVGWKAKYIKSVNDATTLSELEYLKSPLNMHREFSKFAIAMEIASKQKLEDIQSFSATASMVVKIGAIVGISIGTLGTGTSSFLMMARTSATMGSAEVILTVMDSGFDVNKMARAYASGALSTLFPLGIERVASIAKKIANTKLYEHILSYRSLVIPTLVGFTSAGIVHFTDAAIYNRDPAQGLRFALGLSVLIPVAHWKLRRLAHWIKANRNPLTQTQLSKIVDDLDMDSHLSAVKDSSGKINASKLNDKIQELILSDANFLKKVREGSEEFHSLFAKLDVPINTPKLQQLSEAHSTAVGRFCQ